MSVYHVIMDDVEIVVRKCVQIGKNDEKVVCSSQVLTFSHFVFFGLVDDEMCAKVLY